MTERDDGEWEVSIPMLVVDVQLSPDPLQLDVDETGTLTATVRPPNAPVTFEIRNSTVATLAGTAPTLTITGVADGTTAVVAKVEGEEVARATIIVGDGEGDDDDGGGGDDDDDGGGGGDDDDDGGDDPGGPEEPCDIDLDADQVTRNSAHLFWSRCRDDNFVSYKLYRSTEEDFTPSEATHINRGALETQQSQTEYDDTGLAAATTYYYVLVTTHDGQTTESRTSFTTPDASTPELSFEGLARSCAGGIGVDGVHDFTIIGTLKDSDGNLMANTPLTFVFEGNKGHDYQAGERVDNQTGVLHRAKYLPDAAKNQVEVVNSNGEAMTAVTDAEGKVSIKVLSSDIISNDIKMVAKWPNAQGQEEQVGSKVCDFDSVFTYRRFPNQYDPEEIEDTGWLFDVPRLSQAGSTTPAKVYLKHMIDRDVGDVNGNWKYVNQHQLRIKVFQVKLRDGTTLSGTPEQLKDYAFVVDPADAQALSRVVTTGAVPNAQGVHDGAAQVTVKAGSKIKGAVSILVGAEELAQHTP